MPPHGRNLKAAIFSSFSQMVKAQSEYGIKAQKRAYKK